MRMTLRLRSIAPAALAAILAIGGLAPVFAASLQKRAPVKRAPQTPFSQGYQKGYNEGFAQGATDWRNSARRDFRNSERFQQRAPGSSEEYGQGYELGFELGHADGYYGRTRNAVVPKNGEVLAKAAALADQQRARRDSVDTNRAQRDPNRPNETDRPADFDRPRDVNRPNDANRPRADEPFFVPNGTELRIRLSSPISTKTGRVGDTFRATVVSPSTYESGTVEGHIATLNRSGRVSGKTEVALAFDTLTLPDGRQTRIDGELIKVYESESVKKVDEEGRIETGSRTRDSEVRGGVGAAAGAIIGGILGGGKGAIIGLLLGGAAGVGTVYVEGNKDLILDQGTEMVIRIAGPRNR